MSKKHSKKTAAAPRLESAHVDDLPSLSAEEKAEQGRLMELEAQRENFPQQPAAPAEKGTKAVLVRNDTTRLFSVALSNPKGSNPNMAHAIVALLPGVNEVRPDLWTRALEQQMVRLHIQEGDLVEVGTQSLDELGIKGAIKLVADTVHKALLSKWLGNEARPAVRKAIEAQIKKIAPTAPKAAPDDEDADEDAE